VRDLMHDYLASIHAARNIKVKNTKAFEAQMAKLGFGGCKPRFHFTLKDVARVVLAAVFAYMLYSGLTVLAWLCGLGSVAMLRGA